MEYVAKLQIWFQHQQQRIAIMVIALISILILNTLTQQIVAFSSWNDGSNTEAISKTQLSHAKFQATSLANLHLFGIYKEYATSHSAISLNGIFIGLHKQESKVALSFHDQPEALYSIGDMLPDGSVIYDIASDHILIQHDNVIESIGLPWEKLVPNNTDD